MQFTIDIPELSRVQILWPYWENVCFFFFQHTCLIEQTSFGFCNSTLFLATVGWVEDGRNTLNSKLENSDFVQCDRGISVLSLHTFFTRAMIVKVN